MPASGAAATGAVSPPFCGREIFSPPADKLLEAAERIRLRLGDWPAPRAPWRICVAPPEQPGPGDLIVAADACPHEQDTARWLAAGAAVLDATARTMSLHLGDALYVLEGAPCDDWIAALAAFVDCGFAPHDALCLALAWREGDDRSADAWPYDLSHFPRVLGLPAPPAQRFPSCPPNLGLYPVVPTAQWVERLLALGVTTVQLRHKLTDAALQAEIGRAADAGRAHGAQVFINDHWRTALDANAYGVHLGQEDLPSADLNALAQAGLRLGLSTHGYYEILVALHFRPSYIALGAIFPTNTKTVTTAPQGLARLARYVRLLEGVAPTVAIGGIDAANLRSVLSTGVGSAAVVSAVTGAEQRGETVEHAVLALQEVIT
jgi:thiamine-phosphate pyrophosphorylase